MKRLIYAQLEKPWLGDELGFTAIKDAKIKNFNAGIGGTITSRYYKGIGANSDGMVIEVTDEDIHRT